MKDAHTEISAETPVETVERLASLARIHIPNEYKKNIAAEFESVIAYIAQLDELTLDIKENLILPPLHNVYRDDAHPYEPGTWTEDIVRAFPAKEGNALSVKKIISHE